MDEPGDLPRPSVTEVDEVVVPMTGVVLTRIEAHRALKDSLEYLRESHKKIRTSAENLGEQIAERFPVQSWEVKHHADRPGDTSDRGKSFTTPDGEVLGITAATLEVRDPKEHRFFSFPLVSFRDPQNPEILVNIETNQSFIELRQADTNEQLIATRDADVSWKGDRDNLPPPTRDPLDAAREGLDYFLEHVDELKPIEPGQTPPSTPGIPPTQPAPSV